MGVLSVSLLSVPKTPCAVVIWRMRWRCVAIICRDWRVAEGYIVQQLDISIVRKTIRRAGVGRANVDGSRARMCEATVGVVSQGDRSERADRAARGHLAAVEGRMQGR